MVESVTAGVLVGADAGSLYLDRLSAEQPCECEPDHEERERIIAGHHHHFSHPCIRQ